MTSYIREFLVDSESGAPLVRAPEEPLAGLRHWTVATVNGRTELGAVVQDATWPAGGANRAECDEGHRAASPGCSCGFYLEHPANRAARRTEDLMLGGKPWTVTGAAFGWGRVAVDPRHLRTEYARPAALFVHAHHDRIHRLVIEGLAAEYGIETVEIGSTREILNWFEARNDVLSSTEVDLLLRNSPILLEPIRWSDPNDQTGEPIPSGFWPDNGTLPCGPDDVQFAGEYGPLNVYPVVGMKFYAGRKKANSELFEPGREVRLVPEPENPHDPNAVAVYDIEAKIQLGHLPRDVAATLDPAWLAATRAFLLCHWSNYPGAGPFSVHIVVASAGVAERLHFAGLDRTGPSTP